MKKVKNIFIQAIYYLLIICLGFSACQTFIDECTGEVTQVAVALAEFDSIEINDHIQVNLHQADTIAGYITGPEHLISGIEVQVKDNKLILKDNNRAQWLKGFPEFTVDLYLPDLMYIHYKGYGKLQAQDSLRFKNFRLNADNAYGNIHLVLSSEQVLIASNSSTTIHLSGRTDRLYAGSYWNDGRIDASSLMARKVVVKHQGEGLMEVNALESLKGEIQNIGNLLNYGSPKAIGVNISGTGRLIQK
jgi:hypothetical protein